LALRRRAELLLENYSPLPLIAFGHHQKSYWSVLLRHLLPLHWSPAILPQTTCWQYIKCNFCWKSNTRNLLYLRVCPIQFTAFLSDEFLETLNKGNEKNFLSIFTNTKTERFIMTFMKIKPSGFPFLQEWHPHSL
jgi:hypothetical protein